MPSGVYKRTIEHKKWRTSCFERDNYACQKCKESGSKKYLNCVDCHRKTYTYGEGSKKFEKLLKEAGYKIVKEPKRTNL